MIIAPSHGTIDSLFVVKVTIRFVIADGEVSLSEGHLAFGDGILSSNTRMVVPNGRQFATGGLTLDERLMKIVRRTDGLIVIKGFVGAFPTLGAEDNQQLGYCCYKLTYITTAELNVLPLIQVYPYHPCAYHPCIYHTCTCHPRIACDPPEHE